MTFNIEDTVYSSFTNLFFQPKPFSFLHLTTCEYSLWHIGYGYRASLHPFKGNIRNGIKLTVALNYVLLPLLLRVIPINQR